MLYLGTWTLRVTRIKPYTLNPNMLGSGISESPVITLKRHIGSLREANIVNRRGVGAVGGHCRDEPWLRAASQDKKGGQLKAVPARVADTGYRSYNQAP